MYSLETVVGIDILNKMSTAQKAEINRSFLIHEVPEEYLRIYARPEFSSIQMNRMKSYFVHSFKNDPDKIRDLKLLSPFLSCKFTPAQIVAITCALTDNLPMDRVLSYMVDEYKDIKNIQAVLDLIIDGIYFGLKDSEIEIYAHETDSKKAESIYDQLIQKEDSCYE